MISVAVVALTGCASINVSGMLDALRKADRAWAALVDMSSRPVFVPELVALSADPVDCRDGVRLHQVHPASQLPRPDLVLVPGLDDDLMPSLQRNLDWVPQLRAWHRDGARIATSCTGAFLAAEAGVLDGRQATTHWVAAEEFRRRYPGVELTPHRMIVDVGDVITSGGATTFLNLVIYLLERYGDHERAVLAAKVMLIDGDRGTQLPYVAMPATRRHHDAVVHASQAAIEADLTTDLSIEAIAARVGVSTRTLDRRFKAATGLSPRDYRQRARLQTACRLLEITDLPVEAVRASAGYTDPAAFSRTFRRHAGISPSDYRRKYRSGPELLRSRLGA